MTTDLGPLQSVEWEDPADAIERCYELGWTDGLPVVPPTVNLVQRFLDRAGLPPDAVVGSLPERRRTVTADKAAASAGMAGCLPEYFRSSETWESTPATTSSDPAIERTPR